MPLSPDDADGDSLTSYRGLPLSVLDEDFRCAVDECRALGVAIDFDEALRVWDQVLEASSAVKKLDAWYDGDLLAENLLLDEDG